jgi:hypothetical protein
MNRRSFLTALASALVLDPERLLWVPGQKLISIPKPSKPRYLHIDGQIAFPFYDSSNGLARWFVMYREMPLGKVLVEQHLAPDFDSLDRIEIGSPMHCRWIMPSSRLKLQGTGLPNTLKNT